MKILKGAGTEVRRRAFSRLFSSWFPTPSLLLPPAVGVDISDASIKWLGLSRTRGEVRVSGYGDTDLPSGIVEKGIIKDVPALGRVLAELKKDWKGIDCA